MMTLLQDLRHGSRLLFSRPGFTVAAVTALAFGIGASTAMFSLVNAFLLKPIQLRDPEQIVGLYSRDARNNYRAFSYPNYADVRTSNPVFTTRAGVKWCYSPPAACEVTMPLRLSRKS